ncbi:MAG: hypothetical protein JST47_02590 [Bacteroidetes bacterium]|nr:hypothetical protein [Bacteroidota bacterium]MBS1975128.1 hypothetical protein [Bacteroidota bacterium]
MLSIPSIMGLHLHYRLWISELNQDITVLRIFNDYLQEIKNRKMEPEIQGRVSKFKMQFSDLRNEIDELRHQMHLSKMKLAAESRGGLKLSREEMESDNHYEIESRYQGYRKSFDRLKDEFINFESQSL